MAERKAPRRTRERIVATALALFNTQGEPHVTTADIANEMGISPGNLYYHFRNKDEIVRELFAAFQRELAPLLPDARGRRVDVEDVWLLLHLMLERMHAYRFLYRDLVDLATRHRRIATGFGALLRDGESTFRDVFDGMRSAGHMNATDDDVATLARNVMLVVTWSIAHERLRATSRGEPPLADFGTAAYHVLALLAPFLDADARRLVQRIASDYVAVRPPGAHP
jgi:AcrR family transcriptional regulator